MWCEYIWLGRESGSWRGISAQLWWHDLRIREFDYVLHGRDFSLDHATSFTQRTSAVGCKICLSSAARLDTAVLGWMGLVANWGEVVPG
jgi:hypothetical protein